MFLSFRNRRRAAAHAISSGALIIALSPCLSTKSLAQPHVGLDMDATVFVSDNPFLIEGEDLASAAAEVAARPYIDWYLDHRTKLEFTSELAFRQYSQRYGNFVTGFADVELRHRRNEYLTVSAEASYSRELMVEGLTDSVDSAFDSQGVSEIIDTRATVAWSPNARVTITGDGGWRRLRYPDSDLLEMTNVYDAGISASKRLSPRTTVGIQARIEASRPADDGDTSVKSVSLIATHRFSETLHGNVSAGVEWSSLDYSLEEDRDGGAQFNGAATLCYEPEHTAICINGSVGSEVSGLGGMRRETTFGATFRHRLSQHGTLTAEFETRKANLPEDEIPGGGTSARVLRAEGGYEHRLNRSLYLTAGASYQQRQLTGAKVDAVIFQIGLSIRGERP